MIRARSTLSKTSPGKIKKIISQQGEIFNLSSPDEVEIIVAGRNNSEYLKECLESAVNQGVPVTYVDDFSTDNSLEIAESLNNNNNNIKIIALDSQVGACKARNIGWQSTKANKIIFLDADDILTDNFVKLHLSALEPNSPFAYGPAQAFGDLDTLWPVPEWDNYDRWWRNTVNTSSIWTRWALQAVGGWDEQLSTMWDWDLALKCSKLGKPSTSKATLKYRIHDQSHSATCGEREESLAIRELIRRKNLTITISSLISLRLGEDFLIQWLDNLAQVVKYANLPNRVNLNLFFHNTQPLLISRYSNIFTSIKSFKINYKIDTSSEENRQVSVSTLLAKYCALSQSEAAGDLVWLIEDDILPKKNALEQLIKTITTGDVPPTAVSGLYLNRHNGNIAGGEYYECNDNINWEINYLKEYPKDEPFTANVVCTGCLLYYKDRPSTPKYWRNKAGYFNAHDWAWSEDCKNLGGTLLIDPSVSCGHAESEDNILWINMN